MNWNYCTFVVNGKDVRFFLLPERLDSFLSSDNLFPQKWSHAPPPPKKKFFFTVISENFFFVKKIVKWKIFKTSMLIRKVILIFVVRHHPPVKKLKSPPPQMGFSQFSPKILFSLKNLFYNKTSLTSFAIKNVILICCLRSPLSLKNGQMRTQNSFLQFPENTVFSEKII